MRSRRTHFTVPCGIRSACSRDKPMLSNLATTSHQPLSLAYSIYQLATMSPTSKGDQSKVSTLNIRNNTQNTRTQKIKFVSLLPNTGYLTALRRWTHGMANLVCRTQSENKNHANKMLKNKIKN